MSLVVCFSDSLVKTLDLTAHKSAVEDFGGKVVASVTKKLTHFIATKEEIQAEKLTAKLKNAISREDVNVVSIEFLETLKKDGVIPSPEPFLLDFKQNVVVEQTVEVTEGRSRRKQKAVAVYKEEDASEVEEESHEPVKKRKTKAKKTSEDTADFEDESEATSKKISVEETVEEVRMVKLIKKGRCAVDEMCPQARFCHVYQEKDCVYDAMLNQTNIRSNNNKFYLLQVLESDNNKEYFTWFRWGRVGYSGQTSLENHGSSLASAISSFKRKFQDKTKNSWDERADFVKHDGKYFMLERDYGEDQEDLANPGSGTEQKNMSIPESKLDSRLQHLIQLIFNTEMMTTAMVEIGYDAKKMPLGKLTKQHIQKGYNVLKQISDEMNKSTRSRENLANLSSMFYTIIPHEFGMRAPTIIDTPQLLKQKIQMVEALAEIEIATTLIKSSHAETSEHPMDTQYDSLKCDLKPMQKNSDMWTLIEKYVQNTHAETHKNYDLELVDVYQVDRNGESERFVGDKLNNHKLLWHGSRLTNFVGILSQGLRIAPPEAPSTGYMFGKGVYFADMVSKSANYCFTSRSNNTGLLLLCDVALGDECHMNNADYNADQVVKREKKHCTKGCGATAPDPSQDVVLENGIVVPCGKPTNSGTYRSLLYNEFIVYDVKQIKMNYLVEVKFKYRY